MGMLTNVRQYIAQAFTVTTPYEGPLPGTFGRSDSSFVVTGICVRNGAVDEDETIDVVVNDVLGVSWSAHDLVDRYRRFVRSPALPEHLLALMAELTELSSAYRTVMAQQSDATCRYLAEKGLTVAEMTKSLNDAIRTFQAVPGLVLERAVLIPPRGVLRVTASKGGCYRVQLSGLCSMVVG